MNDDDFEEDPFFGKYRYTPTTQTEKKQPDGILLGESDGPVYIPPDTRINHLYIIGLPRHGKTELMKNLMIQDMAQGHGIGFIDPHSDAAKQMLGLIPKNRIKDLIYFNPADPQSPSFNPMALKFESHKLTEDIVSVFKQLFTDSWGPRLEHILRYAILTLLHDFRGQTRIADRHTIADIRRILFDEDYRTTLKIPASLESFWFQEFASLPKNALSSIANKLSALLLPGSPTERIFSQRENDLDFNEILDGKILIVNLAKGLLGSEASRLLGGFIVAGLQQAALARANDPESLREPFFLYLDEFHNFTVNSFEEILAESPKYKMYLTMAHQHMSQISEDLRHAISGTVGTRVAFQIAHEDAQKVKHIMNVSRMLWKKGNGEWQPIMTFKDYAIQVLSNQLDLRAEHETLLRAAQTSFTPTQLRAVAKSHIDYQTPTGVKKRTFPFEDIQFEQEEFPEKYELQNLPKYTAYVRLGDNQHVYRIQTLKCPDPDPMIADYILLKRSKKAKSEPMPERTAQPRAEEFSPTPPLDEPKPDKIEGNGIRDDNRGATGYPGDIREETPLRERKSPRRRAKPRPD